jgi:hypothetical protein
MAREMYRPGIVGYPSAFASIVSQSDEVTTSPVAATAVGSGRTAELIGIMFDICFTVNILDSEMLTDEENEGGYGGKRAGMLKCQSGAFMDLKV